MFLGDLHIHSTFSDGEMSIPQIVDFYGARGFGAIAITDHICETESLIGQAAHYFRQTLTEQNFSEYIELIKEQAERAWKQYRMVVLPGFEISKNYLLNSRSAHIVALNCESFISADGDIVTMSEQIRRRNGLSIAAHPVPTGKWEKQTLHLWSRREELRHCFDAWEVASGAHFFSEVLVSGLPLIASSDLHVRRQMSSWKTVFECERHVEAICDAIRKQNVSFQFYNEPFLNWSSVRTNFQDLILSSVVTTDLAVW